MHMFTHRARIKVGRLAAEQRDSVTEAAIEAGADDLEEDDDEGGGDADRGASVTLYCSRASLPAVRLALAALELPDECLASDEGVHPVPEEAYVVAPQGEEQAEALQALLERLEESPEVMHAATNVR